MDHFKDLRPKRIEIEVREINKNASSHGIFCKLQYPDKYETVIATIPGPEGSPYEKGNFDLKIEFSEAYPFHPPNFKFTTPIYHPNIDNSGKICLDVLKLPPGGTYNPSLRLEAILLSIQLLLSTPNPEDPLMAAIADQFKYNPEEFIERAKNETSKNASRLKQLC